MVNLNKKIKSLIKKKSKTNLPFFNNSTKLIRKTSKKVTKLACDLCKTPRPQLRSKIGANLLVKRKGDTCEKMFSVFIDRICEKQKPITTLKNKIINHCMISGNKKTCEKMLLLSLKSFQKMLYISHKKVLQLAIINTTPTFLVKQIIRKRRKKKKVEKQIPFLPANSVRISFGIKSILLQTLGKNSKLYVNFIKEILLSSKNKGEAVKKKKKIQNQAVENKKTGRFRWF